MVKNKRNKKEEEEVEEDKPKGGQKGKKKNNNRANDDDDDDDDGAGKAKLKGAHTIDVRHILCEKFGKKEQALEKLMAGEAFDDVAREFSEDKARHGGYLGPMTRDKLVPEFAEVAFEIEASDCKDPIWAEAKSPFGYHIIMVHDRK